MGQDPIRAKHVLRHTRALVARETTQRDHWRDSHARKRDWADPGQELVATRMEEASETGQTLVRS